MLYILHCEKIEHVHLGRLYELLLKGARGKMAREPGFGELLMTCTIAPYKRQPEDSDSDYKKIIESLPEVRGRIYATAREILNLERKAGRLDCRPHAPPVKTLCKNPA